LYYQIQGLLRVTDKQTCHFVVWTPNEMIVEQIKRDKKFWKEKMETPLVQFYKNNLLRAIAIRLYDKIDVEVLDG